MQGRGPGDGDYGGPAAGEARGEVGEFCGKKLSSTISWSSYCANFNRNPLGENLQNFVSRKDGPLNAATSFVLQ